LEGIVPGSTSPSRRLRPMAPRRYNRILLINYNSPLMPECPILPRPTTYLSPKCQISLRSRLFCFSLALRLPRFLPQFAPTPHCIAGYGIMASRLSHSGDLTRFSRHITLSIKIRVQSQHTWGPHAVRVVSARLAALECTSFAISFLSCSVYCISPSAKCYVL
jgi:hypothetical protein